MGKIRFIGCLHLGDERLVKDFRNVNSSKEHDEHLIKEWNKVTSKEDTVYILGDVTMETKTHYHKLDLLNGKKIVVMGNHDLPEHSKALLEYVDGVCGMRYLEIDGYKLWITHPPIHPQELTFVDYNIHAHIHHMEVPYSEVNVNYWGKETTIKSGNTLKYINVDTYKLNYQPHTLEELFLKYNIK